MVICTKLVIDALFVVSINYTMCVCVFLNQACPLAVATCMYILYKLECLLNKLGIIDLIACLYVYCIVIVIN